MKKIFICVLTITLSTPYAYSQKIKISELKKLKKDFKNSQSFSETFLNEAKLQKKQWRTLVCELETLCEKVSTTNKYISLDDINPETRLLAISNVNDKYAEVYNTMSTTHELSLAWSSKYEGKLQNELMDFFSARQQALEIYSTINESNLNEHSIKKLNKILQLTDNITKHHDASDKNLSKSLEIIQERKDLSNYADELLLYISLSFKVYKDFFSNSDINLNNEQKKLLEKYERTIYERTDIYSKYPDLCINND